VPLKRRTKAITTVVNCNEREVGLLDPLGSYRSLASNLNAAGPANEINHCNAASSLFAQREVPVLMRFSNREEML
jgi:hypothetical protein